MTCWSPAEGSACGSSHTSAPRPRFGVEVERALVWGTPKRSFACPTCLETIGPGVGHPPRDRASKMGVAIKIEKVI
jgi:hypothetical protein